MVACCGLIATALVLTSVAMGWLPIDGVWPIYAAIALTGMVRAFLSPIYNACSRAFWPVTSSPVAPAWARWCSRPA